MIARFPLACAASFALLACGSAPALPPYFGPGCLCDPVVTHTNGMRLASSEAHRSHNVYWQCDPHRIGYCSGRYYGPVRNDWRSLGTRHLGRFAPPSTPVGPTSAATMRSHDGMEDVSGETLGTLRPAPLAGPENSTRPADVGSGLAGFGGAMLDTLQGQQPAAPQPPTSNWLDAINEVGRKMATTPRP